MGGSGPPFMFHSDSLDPQNELVGWATVVSEEVLNTERLSFVQGATDRKWQSQTCG